MKLVIRAAFLGFILVGGVHAGEMRDVPGPLVDEKGMPVAGADVGFFWTANGPIRDQNGKPIELNTVAGGRLGRSAER